MGCVVAEDIVSPKSIPAHDTSAMDGYAIRSEATACASAETPVVFRVEGTLAAGDDPKELIKSATDEDGEAEPCVEIMTGAIFPGGGPSGKAYDTCVKIEDTVVVTVDRPAQGCSGKHILVTKPVPSNANKRPANSDIRNGALIIRQGVVLRASHIISLAAVGFESVPVVPKPRLAILSTGMELLNGNGATRDANGPYLTTAAREMGLHADFHGVVDDNAASLQSKVRDVSESGRYDLVITSGAVSKGKFDYVRQVLDQLNAEIVFHGLAIRPGHPVLFALIPAKGGRKTAFFGLPGNPGAAAACFRFLTVPYLRALQGQAIEQPIRARLCPHPDACKPNAIQQTDCFRHGLLTATPDGQLTVQPSPDQSPSKVGAFLTANCWIHLRPTSSQDPTAAAPTPVVDCYPLSATGLLQIQPSYPS